MLRFVVNLKSSKDRWKLMQQALEKYCLEVIRVEAVDGRKLTDNEKATYINKNFTFLEPSFYRDLSPAEIGCFLSHRKCWEKLCNSEEDWALIMEDDIFFSDRAYEYINSYSWIPDSVDIVQLHSYEKEFYAKVSKDKLKLPNNDLLLRLVYPIPWGCQAYWISKRAAKEALKTSTRFCVPVDDFMFNPIYSFARKFPSYRLDPAVVFLQPTAVCASTIGKREIHKHRANAAYYLYRFLLLLKQVFLSKRRMLSFK